MTKRRLFAVIACVGLMVFASDAMAQRGGGGRGMGRGGFGAIRRADLLTLESVQSDLQLTDEQKENAVKVRDESREKMREVFQEARDNNSDIREAMAKLNAETDEKALNGLGDEQKSRLDQLYVQANGANSLMDDAIAAKLDITEEQKEKFQSTLQELTEARRGSFQNFRDMSQEERAEAMEKQRKESDEKLVAVLTDDQKEQFAQMKGEALEMDLNSLRRGFGGGGRGGAGGGGRRNQRPE